MRTARPNCALRAAAPRLVLAAAAAALAAPAHAGGLGLEDPDRFALLHDDRAAVLRADLLHDIPAQTRAEAANGYGWSGASTSGPNPSRTTGRASGKIGLGAHVDCMIGGGQPWGRWETRDARWSAANEFAESRLETWGLEAACAVAVPLPGGDRLRVIGGARAAEAELFHMISLPANLAFHLDSADAALGWTAGLSWERPQDGLRATLAWTSPMEFELAGRHWINGAAAGPVTATATMPASVALHLEGRPAPLWTASADLDWTWWSDHEVTIDGVASPLAPGGRVSPPTGYDDALGVELGLKRRFGAWEAGGRLRWDQGVNGAITDAWTAGASLARDIGEHVTLEARASATWHQEGLSEGADAVTGRSWRYVSETAVSYAGRLSVTLGF
ncbi:hypothetical protein ACQ5SO_08795 [Rhodovulum sp. DZ06]|uniref:hypothetical protein n=1 Tax=Rhodovulum sp. DZ06 TaxID=3425126 RepID=UPI003D337D88